MFSRATLAIFAILVWPSLALAQHAMDYEEWYASVQEHANEAGFVIAAPETMPRLYERGLSPEEAYAYDEVDRIEYEEFLRREDAR